MRTNRSSDRHNNNQNHEPKRKARITNVASNVVCLNLSGLLRAKGGAAEIVNQLAKPKALSAGDAIQLPDLQSAILVTEGTVDVLLAVGSELVPVKRLDAGWVFGNLPLLGVETFGGHAVAATDCRVVILDQDALRTILRKSPAITSRLMEIFTRKLLELDIDRVLRHFGMTDALLIHLLLSLADKNELIEGVSHGDLACMLGLSRQGASKALGRLRQRGFVETSPMRIKLLSVDEPPYELSDADVEPR
jgi:CRP-like cAMP-binding protein